MKEVLWTILYIICSVHGEHIAQLPPWGMDNTLPSQHLEVLSALA